MTTLWIVAANAATATLLECTSRQHITEIARLEHPESRLHSRDLESDIPTHGAADRSGLAQRSSAQEHTGLDLGALLLAGRHGGGRARNRGVGRTGRWQSITRLFGAVADAVAAGKRRLGGCV